MQRNDDSLDNGSGGDDSGASNARRQHRRNKNEIEREFVCGWPDCGKQYGTNAALYTHTKNKHKGVEHNNTKRPSTESVSGRKGRPLQSLQETKGFPLLNNVQPNELPKKIQVIKIWSDSRFIEMIHLIGMYGDLENANQFTREMEEDMTPIDEENVKQYVDDILKTFPDAKTQFECPTHVRDFLIKASHFWKQKVQEELNYVLLYAMVFEGQRVQTLQGHIKKEFDKGNTIFKTFYKLIENKPEKSEFGLFIQKIFKILSSQPSQINDPDNV